MASGAKLQIDITADATQAIGALDKASGAVKTYGDNASGASSKAAGIHDSIEKTGGVAAGATTGLRDLGGAMETMGGTVGTMGSAMVTAATAFEAIDGAATLYAAAQGIASGAATVFNGVMKALKITLLTNPIFLIAAIILAIGVALVIAYKKSETFRNIVDGAFKAVMGAIKAVWGWVKNNWPLLLAILTGPFGLAVLAIVKNWDKIKAGAQGVIDWVKRTWHALSGILSAPFNAAWDVIDGIIGKITGAIQSVIDWIGRIHFPSMPSWMDAVLPGMAAPAVAGMARGAAATPRAGAAGVTINITGALDPEGVARQVRRILESSDRRGGRQGVLRPIGTV